MNCPECHIKLYCYDSRTVGDYGRLRRYVCIECLLKFKSSEDLDSQPCGRISPDSQVIQYIKRRKSK